MSDLANTPRTLRAFDAKPHNLLLAGGRLQRVFVLTVLIVVCSGGLGWSRWQFHVGQNLFISPTKPAMLWKKPEEPKPALKKVDNVEGRPAVDEGVMTNSIGMKLVRIPAGKFTMGSPEKEVGRYPEDEGPQRRIIISQPFYLGATEVTRGQFRKFVEATSHVTDAEKNDSDGKGGLGFNKEGDEFEKDRNPKYTWRNTGFDQTDEHPVVNVSWNDAKAFCDWLEKKESKKYRLPTEAEWEYGCRANTTTRFSNGDDEEHLIEVANVADASFKRRFSDRECLKGDDGYVFTAPVGKFKPNAFGLFDMHGNVWEWCQDVYDKDYYKSRPNPDWDPQGPEPGARSFRMVRGGSFFDEGRRVRAAIRSWLYPGVRNYGLGFRVVCVR